MKDPLQPNNNPYELLDLDIDATKKDINKAYMKKFTKTRDSQYTVVRNMLLNNPYERTMIDLLMYNDDYLEQMTPFILDQPSYLMKMRKKTAEAWSRLNKERFMNHACIHSLGVLYYWWAIYLEEIELREDKENIENIPKLEILNQNKDELWESTIAFWACIIANKEMIETYILNKEGLELNQTSQYIEDYFINLFNGYMDSYVTIHNERRVKKFNDYINLFKAELELARKMYDLDINRIINDVKVNLYCGKGMLTQLDLIDATKKEIQERRKKSPKNVQLLQAYKSLSEFGEIYELMKDKKYNQVIEAVELLEKPIKEKKEGIELLAKACMERGKQCFETDLFEEAFSYWEKAMDTFVKINTYLLNIKDKIKDEINNIGKNKAVALMKKRTETSILILENTLKLTGNKDIKSNLAEILATEGIKKLNAVFQVLEIDKTKKGKEVLEEARAAEAMLKRSKELGNNRGKDNYEAAVLFLKKIEMGFYDLESDLKICIDKANKLAENKNFDEAIIIIRKQRKKVSGKGKKIINDKYAEIINLRAVKKSNDFMNEYDNVLKGHQKQIDRELQKEIDGGTLNHGLKFYFFNTWQGGCLMSIIFWIFTAILIASIISFSVGVFIVSGFVGIIIAVILSTIFERKSKYNGELAKYDQNKLPNCSVKSCSNKALYSYKVNNKSVNICGLHREIMEEIVGSKPKLPDRLYKLIQSAADDITEAFVIKKDNKTIRENYKSITKVAEEAKKMR